MPNEIYHKSNWGNANAEGFGDVYFDAAATNKLYNHSDYYENSNGTDKILRDLSNKASIVLTPTAYSNGSLNTVIPPYQVLPTELVTNGDFATDSDWSKGTGWSISNGRATSDASANGYLNQQVYEIGKKYKLSFEVLEGTIELRSVQYSQGTGFYTTGTYSIEVIPTTTSTHFYVYTGFGQSSIDNVSLKEIQEADFDFSRGSSATRVNEKGLIESIASGLPRIDYTSGFGSLLLEPQRTNEVTNSVDLFEYFNNTSAVTETANATTSPDGSVSAYKYQGDGSSTSIRLFENRSFSSNTTYALSVFAKAGTNNFLQLGILGVSGSRTVYFDLATATASSEFGKMENYGNGWYRCILTADVTTGDLSGNVNIYITKSLSETGFDSNADAENATMFLWGAQVEAGSYATSYIVSNSGSTVTRSADVANNSGNADLFNDSEGVLYAEIAALADDLTNRQISINNGTTTDRVQLFYSGSSNQISVFYKAQNGTTQFSLYETLSDITEFNKIAFKWKTNDFALWINGVETDTVSSGVTSTANSLTNLDFNQFNGGNDFYGKTKELAVFKEALTDAELESLTSWVSFTEMATDLEYTLE